MEIVKYFLLKNNRINHIEIDIIVYETDNIIEIDKIVIKDKYDIIFEDSDIELGIRQICEKVFDSFKQKYGYIHYAFGFQEYMTTNISFQISRIYRVNIFCSIHYIYEINN